MADDFSQINRALIDLMKVDEALRVAALSTHAVITNRIHGEGKDAENNRIGSYSTKPAYFSPDRSPVNFTGEGKDGSRNFKNGKPKKTKYFSTGYSGFRREVGRQNSYVDARLTGTLQNDFVVVPVGADYQSGFNQPKSIDKANGIEKRFNKTIWAASIKETQIFKTVFEDEINKRLNR